MISSCSFPSIRDTQFHIGMVKSSAFSKSPVKAAESGGMMWLFDFLITVEPQHLRGPLFNSPFLFCSISIAVRSLQGLLCARYRHTSSTPFSSHSGGNNKSNVLALHLSLLQMVVALLMFVITWKRFIGFCLFSALTMTLFTSQLNCVVKKVPLWLWNCLCTGLASG